MVQRLHRVTGVGNSLRLWLLKIRAWPRGLGGFPRFSYEYVDSSVEDFAPAIGVA